MTQPWASLVMLGAKRWETRSWSTCYRGRIAIHAAKSFPRECRDLCYAQPFFAALGSPLSSDPHLPRGCVLGIATLTDCRRVEDVRDRLFSLDEYSSELRFGNYSDGRSAWHLEDVEVFPEPIPARGMLGLWEWNVAQEVTEP